MVRRMNVKRLKQNGENHLARRGIPGEEPPPYVAFINVGCTVSMQQR